MLVYIDISDAVLLEIELYTPRGIDVDYESLLHLAGSQYVNKEGYLLKGKFSPQTWNDNMNKILLF